MGNVTRAYELVTDLMNKAREYDRAPPSLRFEYGIHREASFYGLLTYVASEYERGRIDALQDSKLCAAAPDMLEALRAWVAVNHNIADYSMPEDEAQARRLAIAAIAKAEGHS